MKKSLKLIVTTIILTIALVTPVLATEQALSAESAMLEKKVAGFGNDISTLVKFDDNCGASDIASIDAIVDAGIKNVYGSNLLEQENYIKYLEAKVGNAIENERVKKGNVNALSDLVKVNPAYQAQLDAAIVEYAKAVADHAAAVQDIANTKAYFAALNKSFGDAAVAKAAKDAQANIANN